MRGWSDTGIELAGLAHPGGEGEAASPVTVVRLPGLEVRRENSSQTLWSPCALARVMFDVLTISCVIAMRQPELVRPVVP